MDLINRLKHREYANVSGELIGETGSRSTFIVFEPNDHLSSALRDFCPDCNVLTYSHSDMANIMASSSHVVVVVGEDDVKELVDQPYARAIYFVNVNTKIVDELKAPITDVEITVEKFEHNIPSKSCENCVMGCCYIQPGRKRSMVVNGERLYLDPYKDEYVSRDELRVRRDERLLVIEARGIFKQR